MIVKALKQLHLVQAHQVKRPVAHDEKREIALEDDGFIARKLIDPQIKFAIEDKK